MYIKYTLYIVLVRLRDMRNTIDINPILLDERYDLGIMGALMYEDFNGDIVDSGKTGDKRIYQELKRLEKELNIKL